MFNSVKPKVGPAVWNQNRPPIQSISKFPSTQNPPYSSMSGEERNHKAEEVDVEKLDPAELANSYGQMVDEEPITMKPIGVSFFVY